MAYITYIMFPILSCLQLAWTHSSPWLLTALNGPWVLGFFWSAFFTGPAWWPTFTLVAGATYHLLQALSWWTPGINAGYWFTVFFNMTSPLGTGANILWLFWVRLGNALGAQTSFWILFFFWWLYTIIGFWFFAMAPFVLVTLFCTWSPAAIIYTLLMVFWLISEGVLTTLIAFFVDVAIEGAGRGHLAEPVVVIAVIRQLVWGVRRTLLQIVAFGRVLPFWRLTQPTVEQWSLDLVHTLAWPLRCVPTWQILSRLIRGDWPDEPLPDRVRFVALLVYRIGDIAATCREDGPVMSWYRYMPNWTWTPFGVVLGFFVHGTNLPWSDEMRAYARTSVRTTGWRILIFFGALVLPEIVFWIWLLFQLTVAGVLLFLGQGMGYAVLSSVFEAMFGPLATSRRVVLHNVPRTLKHWYLRALSWMAVDDRVVIQYDSAVDGMKEFTFRQDLPTGYDLQSLENAVWLRRNRFNTELISMAVFWMGVLSLLVWLPVAIITGIYSLSTDYLAKRLRRIWRALVFALMVPDKAIVFVVGACNYSYWVAAAWLYERDIPSPSQYFQSFDFSNYQHVFDSWTNFLNMLNLLVLFKLSPHPDEDLRAAFDKRMPELRPEHRERKIDILRRNVNRFWRTVDSLALPEFVESVYQPPTVANVKETYTMLMEAGFPGLTTEFIDSIQAPKDDPYLASWAGPAATWDAVTEYAFGPMRVAAKVFEEMANFASIATPGYIHTGTYNSVEAEQASTSRYWSGSTAEEFPNQSFSEVLDDVWQAVRAQYEWSRLATFEYVYDRWVKKYNLGFGFQFVRSGAKGKGRARPLKRSQAVAAAGGKQAFLNLWRFAYRNAGRLVHISTVFTKMETLKMKKALAGSVRTVLSSSFTHHAMTTVWNYMPNHNYKIWDTPMKVGIKFCGADFGKLWDSMARHQYIWAGDMTAFDSSLPPVVVNLVKEIRKRGFDTHKDSARIGQLIDMAYDVLLRHPLGFKSTGKIITKPNQGFTTGHSSTTPDNSIALVVCYMFAWRALTGLRAREFSHYNTLGNFGDDHILGWDAVFGWDPAKAPAVLESIGILMRDEAPGQVFMPGKTVSSFELYSKLYLSRKPSALKAEVLEEFNKAVRAEQYPGSLGFSFLAKKPVPVSYVQPELDAFGITYFHDYTTVHDRERLLGKIKGQVNTKADPSARRARLISLMALTFHQKDVYDMLEVSLRSLETTHAAWFLVNPPRQQKPTYAQVVRQWYSSKGTKVLSADEVEDDAEDKFEMVDGDKVAFFGHATFGENVVRWLADFPTVFSPRVVGNVWTDWLINRYPHLFTWVGALHIRANRLGPAVGEAKVRELISRTPYSFIRASGAFTHCPGPEVVKTSTLLLRHWIFMAWHLAFARRPAPSILSLVSGLDKIFINVQYALLGVQETAVVEVEVDLAAHLLVALLSQLEWDIFEADVHSITVPAPSRLISYMYNNLVRSVSPLGAVDLQPLVARVQALRPGDAFIFSAPTGVGKSTRLMVVTQEAVNMRVVVILPRRLLVLQITEYMRRAFPGHSFGAGTEDGFVPRDWDILYCTAQYALVADLPERCIFVVDECHVAEPAHNTIMRQCLRLRRPTIFVSATPPDWLGQVVHSVLALPANPRFKVQTVEKQADSYRAYLNEAGTFVSLARPRTRILVFTKFVADAVAFASNCGRPACVLSSKHTTLDVKAEVFVSTSVSDAGLTIPDVEYVLSCDQDFTLGTNSAFDEEEVRTMNVSGKHFTLSERVLTQRRGRTGRTSDGIFVLWKLREVLRPAELSPEDYISSLGSLIPRVYVDLPAHVQRILPTQQEMTTAGPLWITELAPWIPPDTVNPEDDTNKEAHAKIMASMLSQARIFDPTGGQEYSYLTPEEIAPVDGEGFPVLIPRGARIEVWYMGLEAHAEALFTERTGGDTLERQLLEFMRSADISEGALTVLLRDAGVHILSFASMLWIMPRTGAIWKMLHPHLAGPTVPPAIKRFMDRYIAANIQQRVVGRLTEVAIPAPPPVSVTPDLAQFISHLGINRGIGTMTVLTTASAINISYLQCILFLQGTEDAIKLLQMPAAARPPNMNRLLIRLYQQWRR